MEGKPMVWEVRVWEGMLCTMGAPRTAEPTEQARTAEEAIPLLLQGQTVLLTHTELNRLQHLRERDSE